MKIGILYEVWGETEEYPGSKDTDDDDTTAPEAAEVRPRGSLPSADETRSRTVVHRARWTRYDALRACQEQGRSGFQPGRVVRRRRHEGHEHPRLHGPRRRALHRIGSARPVAGARQSAREENRRVPWPEDALLGGLPSRPRRLLARREISADRQAGLRGWIDRHQHGFGGPFGQRADGSDSRAARRARRADPDRGVH